MPFFRRPPVIRQDILRGADHLRRERFAILRVQRRNAMQSNYRILLGVIITFRDGESKSPRIPGWRDKLNGFCAPGNGWADSGYQLSEHSDQLTGRVVESPPTRREPREGKNEPNLSRPSHTNGFVSSGEAYYDVAADCVIGAAGGEGGISMKMKRDEAIRQPKWNFRPRLPRSASNCWLAVLEPARRLPDNYVNRKAAFA